VEAGIQLCTTVGAVQAILECIGRQGGKMAARGDTPRMGDRQHRSDPLSRESFSPQTSLEPTHHQIRGEAGEGTPPPPP